MGWADNYIRKLQAGETIQFRPRGNSMTGKIDSGQLVTVAPIGFATQLKQGDIVLCKVGGRQYLHLVTAVSKEAKRTKYQISNNKGHVNGWTSHKLVYGIVTAVE